jgi:phage gp36-like protein
MSMFLTTNELKTHLYGEQIEAISGGDETILTAAIDGAISEARGYLAAFDRDTIFAATGSDRNGLLLIFVKDIAVWHYVNLCNAGTDLKLRQDRYERAVSWLREVQKGNVSPDLPVVIDDDGVNPNAIIIWGSNPKRNNHF